MKPSFIAIFALAFAVACVASDVTVAPGRVPARPNRVINITGSEIEIGVILSHTNYWTTPGSVTTFNDRMAAVELAVAEVNADSRLLPNHTLVVRTANSQGSEFLGFLSVSNLAEAGVPLIVGPLDSVLAPSVASAGSIHGINTFDASISTSSELQSNWLHRFSRPLTAEARTTAEIVHFLGWRRVGTFVGTSPAMIQWLSIFRQECAALGINTDDSVTFPTGTSEVQDFIDIAMRMDARVWVYGSATVDGGVVLPLMHASGFLSPSYVWLSPQSGWPNPSDVTGEVGAALDGTFWVGTPNFNAGAVAGWGERLSQRLFGQTLVESTEAGRVVDPVFTQGFHDVTMAAAAAVDALVRVRQECNGAAGAGAGQHNCSLYNAVSDDEAIWHLVRTGTVVFRDSLVGMPISYDEDGARVVPYAVLQTTWTPSAGSLIFTNPLLVLPGTNEVVDGPDTVFFQAMDGSFTTTVPKDSITLLDEEVIIPVSLAGSVTAVSAVAAAAILAAVCGTLHYRKKPIIRMSSYRVNLLTPAGAVLALASIPVSGFAEVSATSCTATLWMVDLGYTLMFAPLFATMYRVHAIFNTKHVAVVKIGDAKLLRYTGAVMLAQVSLLAAHMAVSPMEVLREVDARSATGDPNIFVNRAHVRCSSPHEDVFRVLQVAFVSALLGCGVLLSIRTRNVDIAALNDSRSVGASVMAASIVQVLVTPMLFLIGAGERDALFVVESLKLVLVSTIVVSLVFGTKLFAITTGTADEWTVKSSARSHETRQGSKRTEMHSRTPGGSSPRSGIAAGAAPTVERPSIHIHAVSRAGPSSAPGSPVPAKATP